MTPLALFKLPSKSAEILSKEEKPITKSPPKPGSGRHLVEGKTWEFFNPLRPSRLNPLFGRHLVDRKILEAHFRVLGIQNTKIVENPSKAKGLFQLDYGTFRIYLPNPLETLICQGFPLIKCSNLM